MANAKLAKNDGGGSGGGAVKVGCRPGQRGDRPRLEGVLSVESEKPTIALWALCLSEPRCLALGLRIAEVKGDGHNRGDPGWPMSG